MKVAVFYPNNTWEIKEISPDNHKDLQELVGGYFEVQFSGNFCIYVNETGVLDQLQTNYFAAAIVTHFSFHLLPAGPLVLVEQKYEKERSLSKDTIEKIENYVQEWICSASDT